MLINVLHDDTLFLFSNETREYKIPSLYQYYTSSVQYYTSSVGSDFHIESRSVSFIRKSSNSLQDVVFMQFTTWMSAVNL